MQPSLQLKNKSVKLHRSVSLLADILTENLLTLAQYFLLPAAPNISLDDEIWLKKC